jgi:hypothetical protein
MKFVKIILFDYYYPIYLVVVKVHHPPIYFEYFRVKLNLLEH